MTDWIRGETRLRLYARALECGSRAGARTGKRLPALTRVRCAYCGYAVLFGVRSFGVVSHVPSDRRDRLVTLDHVTPGAGNLAANLVVACWACNCAKGADAATTPPQAELRLPGLDDACAALVAAYGRLPPLLPARLENLLVSRLGRRGECATVLEGRGSGGGAPGGRA